MADPVCTLAELRSAPGQRLQRRLPSGRGVVLWLLGGGGGEEVAVADHLCYHHGGPLADGDIEELSLPPALAAVGGRPSATVVLCPWHLYKIDIRSGECYYMGSDAALRSKGVRQRTHGAVIGADGFVGGLGLGGGGVCAAR